MNEGKPTKAGPTGEQEESAEPAAAGATPSEAVHRDTEPDRERARGADGDFELARPAVPATTPGGDYELHRPLSAEATEATQNGEAAVAGRLAGAVEPAGAGYGVGQTEQPRPLHDPDPYSTPPYGEPGPWAPAPPVQHPAATPAQDTAVPPPVRHPASDLPVPGAPAPAAAAPTVPTVLEPGTPAASHTAPAPPAASATDTAAAADPWQRYDPWAAPAAGASAPLQQTGVAEPTKDQRRKRARRKLIGLMLVIALASGVVGGIVGAHLERNGGVGAVKLPQSGEEPAGRDPGSIAGIAAQALPSVVTLHVSGAASAGTGTGFVLDGRGHILTNDHVVQPAGSDGEITVTFHSGDTARATLVGRDSGYDLAVVKVKGVSGLDPLPLGNSDNVRVGDPVIAIGAPFDLAGTVTAGIISARERPITAGGGRGDGSDVSYVDALQTDAPINPGNSGGPLLDAQARVIGINSAIRSAGSGGDEGESGQAGSIGLGFAIPINQGKRVAEELINTGKATHPVIGITLDMDYTGDGARVGTRGSDGGPPVSTGGPGAKAGIKAGDVITKVDGRRVHSGEELIVKTRAHRPGDRLELTLERDGEEREVSLVLGSSGGD